MYPLSWTASKTGLTRHCLQVGTAACADSAATSAVDSAARRTAAGPATQLTKTRIAWLVVGLLIITCLLWSITMDAGNDDLVPDLVPDGTV